MKAKTMQTFFTRNLLLIYFFVSITLLFSGCSSIPRPVGEFASAKSQIQSAESSDASSLAPVELDRAKTKLRNAERAAAEKKYLTARLLAEESISDARLATAKARTARAERSAQEMRDTVQTMEREIERIQRQ
jgi:hypothetical protein